MALLHEGKQEEAEAYFRQVTDELMTRLQHHFDDDAIVELTGLIAFQNLSSKFNSALDVPPQGFCKLPGAPAGEPKP